jgi:glycosyltransferase involved in cell wall biosynthesis
MNKTVLIIAYFFPPLGMGGVQRMAKLAKYLPRCGYDVNVLTVRPIRYPAHDDSLLQELPAEVKIFRSGSSDPARIGKIIPLPVKAGARVKAFAKENSSRFWPDSKIGWKRPALRLARKIANEGEVDIIISSSPPITAHLVAMDLKNETGIPWIADFRDPWESLTAEEVYKDESLIERSKLLLSEIVNSADAITSINDTISRSLTRSAKTIMGGYDPEDFDHLGGKVEPGSFTLCYMGTSGKLHPLEPFFEAAQIAIGFDVELKEQLRFRIIGANDNRELKKMAHRYDLSNRLEIIDYIPHQEAIQKASEADVSLISVPGDQPGILTGKIFDYLPLPAPLLASVPAGGEIEKVIKACKAGVCVEPGQPKSLAEAMLQLFRNHQSGIRWDKGDISAYTREEIARHFARICDRIICV